MKISLDTMINHWVKNGNTREMSSILEINIFNFVTVAGSYTKDCFTRSFMYQGFYNSGSKWQPRESKWGKKKTHPILIEHGTLRDFIKGDGDNSSRKVKGNKYLKRVKYEIWTDEKNGPYALRRKKKGYLNYAAVHNEDANKTGYHVNQYSTKKPVRRQFMGTSQSIDDYVKNLYPMIFKGFPGHAKG